MATTVVRVYRLEPSDVQVRQATHQGDGEFVVDLGDTVSIQGDVGQLKALLDYIGHRLTSEAAVKSRGTAEHQYVNPGSPF